MACVAQCLKLDKPISNLCARSYRADSRFRFCRKHENRLLYSRPVTPALQSHDFRVVFLYLDVPTLHFPERAAAPAPPAFAVSIGVAPSAFSFFSVRSRWCSITLRFLKYVTCPACQHHVLLPQLQRSNCTYPATRASALEFPQLWRASLPCFLVLSYTVNDVVLVETLEELVASIPALSAGATIGCYEAAILRRSRRRRRGLRRGAEPAHVSERMRRYQDVCVGVRG